jgi:hypothetical protein
VRTRFEVQRPTARRHRVMLAAVVAAAAGVFAGSALGAAITSFSPIQGSIDAGGTMVTLTGTGFAGAKAVYFNGSPAAWFQVGSDTVIYAIVPQNVTSGFITITAADGSAASTKGLTITGTNGGNFAVLPSYNQPGTNTGLFPPKGTAAAPKVSSFAPTSVKPGNKVTVTGANFGGATAVTVGGVVATFHIVSATSLTLTVPAKAKTALIKVTTHAGSASSAHKLTVKA